MKYKVGDKVKVREDLIVGEESFVSGMVIMKGKEVTIDKVHEDVEIYRIKECGFNWTEKMFEDIRPSLKGKIVEVAAGYTYYMLTEARGVRETGYANNIRWTSTIDFRPVKIWEVNASLVGDLSDLCAAKGELIWEEEKKKKEMTVAEIEKALGYSVKIIKE